MAIFWVVAPCSLVNFYQTTRRYNPEDSHLSTHRRENLRSYLTIAALIDSPALRLHLQYLRFVFFSYYSLRPLASCNLELIL
jgi:hypothetical protein